MNDSRWLVVLFDLDGTLADSIPVIVASFQHAFQAVKNEQISDERAKAWIGRTLPDIFTEADPLLAADLEREYRYWNESHMAQMLTGFQGIPDLCESLVSAGRIVAVITAKRRSVAQWSMQLAGLPSRVQLACAMEDTPVHKPAPEPLLYAMDTLNADPSQCVYVGDAVFDIQSAQAAGIDQIGVTWGAAPRADLETAHPTYLVSTPTELGEVLLG